MSELPSYRQRVEIRNLADDLVGHSEPAASPELSGVTAEGVSEKLDEIEVAVQAAREQMNNDSEVTDDE